VATGPYMSHETGKYFQHIGKALSESDGHNLIIDSDFYTEKFSLTINPKKFASSMFRDADEVINRLIKALKETENAKYN
jgi:hypothetical protein